MDIVKLKLRKFEKALQTLEEVVAMDLQDNIIRDSAIQRFEYTIELFWKTLKVYLQNDFDIKTISPRQTIKEACAQKILDDNEASFVLEMLRLRNETSHEYAIETAKFVVPKLNDFTKLLRKVSNDLSM